MKKTVAWAIFCLLTPAMLVGSISYLLVDAFKLGWKLTEEFLDDL